MELEGGFRMEVRAEAEALVPEEEMIQEVQNHNRHLSTGADRSLPFQQFLKDRPLLPQAPR